jgi:MarR family transcriptional regulator, negative regulator of the multidrug operon emrRAB
MALRECITMMDQGVDRLGQVVPGMPATEARLARLLLMVGHSFDEVVEQALKPQQLNHSDFLTLMILYSRPDGSSTPGELCEYTSQGATNMTRIANVLVKRGLITRGASAQDRRRVVIRITAAGRRFVQKLLPPLFPRLIAAFAGFGDTDKRRFGQLLRKLADNLDRMDENPLPVKDAR